MAVIRQKTQMFNQPIGVVRASTGGEQIGQAISRFAGDIQKRTFEVAAEDAQQRGIDTAKAIEEKNLSTFNPETGKPEAFTAPKGMGRIASQAYQRVVDARFEESMQSELRNKAQEIALKFPYDADGYENVMSKYIESMHLNATGKYKEFVIESGSDFLAQTKTNIQAKAIAKVRADLSDSLVASLDQAEDAARSMAAAGLFIPPEGETVSDSDYSISSTTKKATDGVDSSLLKKGSERVTRTALQKSTALGGVDYVLTKTTTSVERNSIALALRQGDVKLAPKRLQKEVLNLLKYVNVTNVDSVVQHLGAARSQYDAVERDEIARQEAIAEAQAKRLILINNNSIDSYGQTAIVSARVGFDANDPSAVAGSVSALDNNIRMKRRVLENQFVSGMVTETTYNEDSRDLRRASLRPLLIEAAAEGNSSELAAAISSNDPADRANLTANQLAFVDAYRSSEFLYSPDDSTYVEGVLERTVNSAREEREKQTTYYNLMKNVEDVSNSASTGRADAAVVDKLANDINKNKDGAISATQALALEGKLYSGQAIGVFNRLGANLSSSDLNILSGYIKSNGNTTKGMTTGLAAIANQMFPYITDSSKEAISGRIGSAIVQANTYETKRSAMEKQQRNIQRVAMGNGNRSSAADQKIVDDILRANGINPLSPESETAETAEMFKVIMPTTVITSLKAIASGAEANGAEIALNHYARNRFGVSSAGRAVNHIGDAISSEDQAFLDDVIEIRNDTNESVLAIAQRLTFARQDPQSKEKMDFILNGETLNEFVLQTTDMWFESPDPILASKLQTTAEYLLRTGNSKEQTQVKLAKIIDSKYPKVQFVADASMPLGSLKRSDHGLEATFPNDEDREEFLRIVESELPEGYSLYGGKQPISRGFSSSVSEAIETTAVAMFGDVDKSKQVLLVPLGGSANPSYVAHYVNEQNELVPLIYTKAVRPDSEGSTVSSKKKRSQEILPMFDSDSLEEFRAARMARDETRSQDAIEIAEATARAWSEKTPERKPFTSTAPRANYGKPGSRSGF